LIFAAIGCVIAMIPSSSPAIVIFTGGVAGAFLLRGKDEAKP
jgi:hypothetical protein